MTITDSVYYQEPLNVTVYFEPLDDKDTLEYDCTADLWRQAVDAYKESKKKN